MNALVVLAALAVGAESIPEGSLIVLENSNKTVEKFLATDISHVAMIMRSRGTTWVYEATPAKVRRVALREYLRELGRINSRRRQVIGAWLMRPDEPFSSSKCARMRAYLDAQLGRRYSIRGYLRNSPGDGIHCAALTANALQRSGRVRFPNAFHTDPKSLVQDIRHFYRAPQSLRIPVYRPPRNSSWCSRSAESWSNFCNWCQWSFGEMWRFCF